MDSTQRGSFYSSSENMDKSSSLSETEQRNNDLTPEVALTLVQPFFPNEWGKLDPKDVQLEIIT